MSMNVTPSNSQTSGNRSSPLLSTSIASPPSGTPSTPMGPIVFCARPSQRRAAARESVQLNGTASTFGAAREAKPNAARKNEPRPNDFNS